MYIIKLDATEYKEECMWLVQYYKLRMFQIRP